jgi:PKD repeat protein
VARKTAVAVACASALLIGCSGDPASSTSLIDLIAAPQVAGETLWNTGTENWDPNAPVAVIGATPGAGVAPVSVQFTGFQSIAAVGQIATYDWDFGDGAGGSGSEVYHTFASPGAFSVRLTVSDDAGSVGSSAQVIAILPAVGIQYAPDTDPGAAPLAVRFQTENDALLADFPLEVSYHWDFGDGTTGEGSNVVHVYPRASTYTVALSLVVATLSVDCATTQVVVKPSQAQISIPGGGVPAAGGEPAGSDGSPPNSDPPPENGDPPNVPPVADAGPDQTVADSDVDDSHPVVLDGSGSYDPEGGELAYRWTEGATVLYDGPNATVGVVPAVGTHTITLAVTDNGGLTATDGVVVTVLAGGALAVSPADGLTTSGYQGGPFDPNSKTYTLTNNGEQALSWTAAKTQAWVNLSVAGGTLAVGASTTVAVSIDPNANGLAAGSYSDTVTFTNATNNVGTTTHPVGLVVSPPPGMASSISQYGITWTFDQPYQVGQFVNGDWWVTPLTADGTVTVVAIDPAPVGEGSTYRNGSMANPDSPAHQGYDGRAYLYSASVSVVFPYGMSTNVSLISTVSRGENECFNPPGSNLYSNTCSRGYIADAAILTCLPGAPPADALRPAYCGSSKIIHSAGSIDLNNLPNLASVAGAPSLSFLEPGFQRVWLDHMDAVAAQAIRPNNHMPSYGRDMASWIGQANLVLCLGDVGDRTVLARYMAQLGIDFYGIIDGGGGGTNWGANGGHGHGRKLPIALAGYLLYDPNGSGEANDRAYAMLHVGLKPRYGAPGAWSFQEDENHWTISIADVGRTIDIMAAHGLAESASADTLGVTRSTGYAPLETNYVDIVSGPGSGQRRYISSSTVPRGGGSGIITVSVPWDVVPVVGSSEYQVVGYEASHIGMAEWGINHSQVPYRDNPGWAAEYRTLVGTSSVGFTLAARLIGLKDVWVHDALFEYMDRYMLTETVTGFAANMWAAYRGQY